MVPRPSISVRLAVLVVAVVLPCLAVLGWIFAEQLSAEHRSARESAIRIARSIASDMGDATQRSQALMAAMAARPKIRIADPLDCDSLFAIVDFFPQYLDLLLYDTAGHRVCSATPQPSDVPFAAAIERSIPDYLRTSHGFSREPMVTLRDGRMISVSFRPVTEKGLTTGVLALMQYVDFDIDAYPPGTVVTIVDGRGTIVARSRDNDVWNGRGIRESEIGQIVRGEAEGRAQATGIDGEVRQYGFTRVPGTDWTVYVGLPTGVAMASVRSLMLKGIIAALLITTITILLGRRLSRSIQQPLAALALAAERVGQSGYSGRVDPSGPREVAVVAEAFNTMVDSRSRAERDLIESRLQLQALSEKLLEIQEQERTRIAREIHDELGQLLTAAIIETARLAEMVKRHDSASAAVAQRIRESLDTTLAAVRRIAAELRPAALDDFGLVAAIEAEMRHFEERTGIECDLSIDHEPLVVEREAEAAIYRIVQEALTNVARHSEASRVEIRIRQREDELFVEIRDDGRGITAAAMNDRTSLGLVGMRERARGIGGAVEIDGIADLGTIVLLRLPMAHSMASTAS